MRFVPSTFDDLTQIQNWIQADPWHKDRGQPEWWLTGNGLLSFRVDDEKGSVAFMRMDKEENEIRLHVQFGPYEEVSKKRLIRAMLKTLPTLLIYAKQNGSKVVFNSTSRDLTQFMEKYYGFVQAQDNDYVLEF